MRQDSYEKGGKLILQFENYIRYDRSKNSKFSLEVWAGSTNTPRPNTHPGCARRGIVHPILASGKLPVSLGAGTRCVRARWTRNDIPPGSPWHCVLHQHKMSLDINGMGCITWGGIFLIHDLFWKRDMPMTFCAVRLVPTTDLHITERHFTNEKPLSVPCSFNVQKGRKFNGSITWNLIFGKQTFNLCPSLEQRH